MEDELEAIRARKMWKMMHRAHTPMPEGQGSDGRPIILSDANFDQVTQKYPLVVVDFWAEWCGPCRMMAPIFEELAKAYAGKVVFGKLNVDENLVTAQRFGISGIPTLLILKNGVEVDRIVGVAPKDYIESRFQAYL